MDCPQATGADKFTDEYLYTLQKIEELSTVRTVMAPIRAVYPGRNCELCGTASKDHGHVRVGKVYCT